MEATFSKNLLVKKEKTKTSKSAFLMVMQGVAEKKTSGFHKIWCLKT